MNVGLIFGMIVAIIIIGSVIVFAYDQLANMQRLQQIAEINRAKEDLENAVERVHGLSGITSEAFKLSFPGGVTKVCFIPSYRGEYIGMKESKLRSDLYSVIDATANTRRSLSEALTQMRITQNPDGSGKYDKNQTLLIFVEGATVPDFEEVPYLGPSKKKVNGDTEVLCVPPRSRLWLQRKYDNDGAWVDVEEA